MPRGKKPIYKDGSVVGEKTYYYRRRPDIYGKSKIWIEELDNNIIFNGQKIWIPTLDISKYYSGARVYAFIEELEERPVTLIDVLYSYGDILPSLENDDNFLDSFLDRFCRRNINIQTYKTPGLIMAPPNQTSQRSFADAIKLSLQDAVSTSKFPLVEHYMEEEQEVNDDSYDYKNAKEDGIAMEFIKDFYEIISGTKIRRPTEPKKKKIKESISRRAVIMKIGSTIINGENVGKYCFAYNTSVQNLTTVITMQIAGLDDEAVLSEKPMTGERLKRFGDTIFESNILETFIYINSDKKPINLFAGKYNEQSARLEVNRSLEQNFDKLNELLYPTRTDKGGR